MVFDENKVKKNKEKNNYASDFGNDFDCVIVRMKLGPMISKFLR